MIDHKKVKIPTMCNLGKSDIELNDVELELERWQQAAAEAFWRIEEELEGMEK